MKNYLFIRVSIALLLLFVGCASKTEVEGPKVLVDDKYRLLEDRQKVEELRQEIPTDKKVENDELAFTLKWMNDLKLNPSDIRSRFNSALSKQRNAFNRDSNVLRQVFSKEEKKKRDEFNKELNEERSSITSTRRNSKDKKEKLDEIDLKRKDFAAQQKLSRDTFEEDLRDKKNRLTIILNSELILLMQI